MCGFYLNGSVIVLNGGIWLLRDDKDADFLDTLSGHHLGLWWRSLSFHLPDGPWVFPSHLSPDFFP